MSGRAEPAPVTPAAPQAPQAEATWALCLAIVAQRRAGSVPTAASAWVLRGQRLHLAASGERPALRWQSESGWRLAGRVCVAARTLFQLYKPLLDQRGDGTLFRLAHLGQSLDGCIATHTGDSCYVNGDDNLVHLHRLRALCDAVVVGAGTVVTDNPRLTTRLVPGSNPVRVVLDPAARVPPESGLFTDAAAPTLLVCDQIHAAAAAQRYGTERVVPVVGLRHPRWGLDTAAASAALAARGLSVLFVEGGGVTVSRFLSQGCVERLQLAIAPVVIGAGGRAGLQLPATDALRDCLRPPCQIYRMGPDVLWDLDLRAKVSS